MATILLSLLGSLIVVGFLSYRLYQHQATGAPFFPSRKARTQKVLVDPQRDERRLGYRYADDHIFVQGDGVFTGLVLPLFGDELATADEIGGLALSPVGLYTDLVKLFDGESVHCMEQVRYRSTTAADWLKQLMANMWNPTRLYKILAEKVARHIEGSTPQRFWCLQIRLGDFPRRPGFDPFAGVVEGVMGIAEERITRKDLLPWWERAEQVHRVGALHGAEPMSRQDLLWLIRKPVHGHLPVTDVPVTRTRPWKGGFFELSAVLRAEKVGGGIIKLTQRDPVSGEDNHSYTATLVVVDEVPRKIFNPRTAWGKKLAALSSPVEIIWRYTLVPGKAWAKITNKFVDNVEDEEEDRNKAGVLTDLAFEARLEQADNLKAANAEDPTPGMVGRLRLSVSAPTLRALARTIDDVKTAMGTIEVDVSEHAALMLLEEQLPGDGNATQLGSLSAGKAGGLNLWNRHSDIYKPAIGLLGAQGQVGDRLQVIRGRVVGWIGMISAWVKANGIPVSLDSHAQLARGGGAGVAVAGASGGGKSSYSLSQFFWMSESGVAVSVLDPKIEFRNFVCYISFGPQVLEPGFVEAVENGTAGKPGSRFQPVNREFWDETQLVDLARGERGILCPWRLTKTFREGYQLAANAIDGLFADKEQIRYAKKALRLMDRDWKQAQATKTERRFGMGDLVTYLHEERDRIQADLELMRAGGGAGGINQLREDLDQIDQVIERFEVGETQPFLRLLLGKGSDEQIKLTTTGRRRTIYTLAGYVEPENQDQALWTDENRNAATVMTIMLHNLYQNLSGNLVPNPVTGTPGRPPTAVIVDEAPVVTGQSAGRAFIRKAIKQGRSLNAVLYLIDQRTKGLSKIEEEARGEGDEVNQFPTILMFKQKGRPEARTALAVLREVGEDISVADREEMASKLIEPKLQPGEAVVKDSGGRVAVCVIDQLFWVIQRASQTNPQLVAQDWAHPVPTRPEDWEINPEGLMSARTAVASSASETDEVTTTTTNSDFDPEWGDEWADETGDEELHDDELHDDELHDDELHDDDESGDGELDDDESGDGELGDETADDDDLDNPGASSVPVRYAGKVLA